MKNKGLQVAAGVVLVLAIAGGAFWGGTLVSVNSARQGVAGSFPGKGPGSAGPLAQLSEEERAKVQAMTPEEAREFMQERMGGEVPGGPGVRAGAPPVLTGELIAVDEETLTMKLTGGGSATAYLKDDTVTAFAAGVDEDVLSPGDPVTVLAEPAADNVMNATLVVVTR